MASGYDVAVVGASIAGCTSATLLARSGARVALLESHADPQAYKRVCTHYIQPSSGPTIDRLGVLDALYAAGGRQSGGNLWTRYGWISFSRENAPSPARDWPGLNIRREKLDPMLRELAGATDGVELMLGYTVASLVHDGERVAGVRLRERSGEEREIRAKLVVAADGRDSQVAEMAGIDAKLKPHNRFGYWAYYRDTPLVTGDGAQLWFLDPDMAYAFPTDDGLVCLTVMPVKERLSEFKPDPEAGMARMFETLADAPRIDPAKRVSKVLGKLEVPNVVRSPAKPGLALVGDAALAADPLWGVGCGWAFQSGEWLADAVAPALSRGGAAADVDAALEAYRRTHRKKLAAHEQFTSAYSTGRRFNPMEKLLYRAAARDEWLADRMSLMGSRWITPQELLTPALLARVIRVNLSRGRAPVGLRRAPSVAAAA
ncbi:MAG TPA: NAD(P)/FAD-dependent oxidoreductase [Thermoleophilaceae bacterium]|nr:NAD(P)/FAD-dependent oxidoreductase [Thermoleophilaceae bacterium]